MAAFLVARIDALLPQTQCTRCGYPTCHDYAEAIAAGDAAINRCPPGGKEGIAALASLLEQAIQPLDPSCGIEEPPTVALIDEATCIGCTKCIQACPVDAIVGAGKRMHTVIAAECTGCGLCLPPCPVDCIELVPTAPASLPRPAVMERAANARARFEARKRRLSPATRNAGAMTACDTPSAPATPSAAADSAVATGTPVSATDDAAAPPITRSAVLAAIERGRARRAAHGKERP